MLKEEGLQENKAERSRRKRTPKKEISKCLYYRQGRETIQWRPMRPASALMLGENNRLMLAAEMEIEGSRIIDHRHSIADALCIYRNNKLYCIVANDRGKSHWYSSLVVMSTGVGCAHRLRMPGSVPTIEPK